MNDLFDVIHGITPLNITKSYRNFLDILLFYFFLKNRNKFPKVFW